MHKTTVGKWGNATAIRIPQALCSELGIEPGDEVTLRSSKSGRQIIIEAAPKKHTLEARLANWEGGRYQTTEYDWGEPAGKELW